MIVKISEILKFLDQRGYKYTFKGNEEDNVMGYSSLFNYKVNTITFISSLNKFEDFSSEFERTQIQLIIIDEKEEKHCCFKNIIVIKEPKKVFFDILEHVFKGDSLPNTIMPVEENKYSYISKKAKIGRNVLIGIGTIIEDDVIIGDNTIIHHNVVIRDKTKVGGNCTIYSGTVIGERGFNPFKNKDKTRTMIQHFGGVEIKNNVHIGDNCTISRGTIDDTIIQSDVKINKQVNIAHNVIIKKGTVITAPTFVCGSVTIGEYCHIAATTIRNQCTVGDNAILGLGSVVVKDVPNNITVVGNPAKPLVK